MKTRLLNAEEFAATRLEPQRIDAGEPPLDFWPYVEAIPAEDFAHADCRAGQVSHVYRMSDQYEHVLINSQLRGLAMVIVIDLQQQRVYGHHLLDVSPLMAQADQKD